MLSQEEIIRIASLARLSLTEAEVKKFQKELSALLEFFDEISEVNTDGVEPTAQVTGLVDQLRDDLPSEESSADDMLNCSAHPKNAHQVSVPAVL